MDQDFKIRSCSPLKEINNPGKENISENEKDNEFYTHNFQNYIDKVFLINFLIF